MRQDLLQTAFDRMPIGIAVMEVVDDRLGPIVLANDAAHDLFGRRRGEVVGLSLEQAMGALGAPAEPMGAAELVRDGREEYLIHVDGSFSYLSVEARFGEGENGAPLVVATLVDATERHALEARFAFVADHDPLTGLLNRRGFESRLSEALARAARHREHGAVLALDIDGLREINETDGHAAGDVVLQRVGFALRERLRATDVIARTGGDEFGVMLAHVDRASALAIGSGLVAHVRTGLRQLGGAAATGTISMGLEMFGSAHPITLAEVLDAADAALAGAKRAGRARALLTAVGNG